MTRKAPSRLCDSGFCVMTRDPSYGGFGGEGASGTRTRLAVPVSGGKRAEARVASSLGSGRGWSEAEGC